jgi:small subunit ribosomal protein S8
MGALGVVVSDPVGDMLTRIRNAAIARKETVEMPASSLRERVAKILVQEGYVDGVDLKGEGKDRVLIIDLKYGRTREPAITGLRRVSRPGRRVYAAKDRVPRVLGGLGVAILSTSKGIVTDRDARKMGVGGEILARVW